MSVMEKMMRAQLPENDTPTEIINAVRSSMRGKKRKRDDNWLEKEFFAFLEKSAEAALN